MGPSSTLPSAHQSCMLWGFPASGCMGLTFVAGLTTLGALVGAAGLQTVWLSGPAACQSCWPSVSGTGSWHRWIFGLRSPGSGTLPWVGWVVLGWLVAGLTESQCTRGPSLVLPSLAVWPGVSQGSWLWDPGDPEAGTGQWWAGPSPRPAGYKEQRVRGLCWPPDEQGQVLDPLGGSAGFQDNWLTVQKGIQLKLAHRWAWLDPHVTGCLACGFLALVSIDQLTSKPPALTG